MAVDAVAHDTIVKPEFDTASQAKRSLLTVIKNDVWRACIASLLGEKERAVALLKEAFSQGLDYGVYIHRDINLEPLWDYQPFKELLRPKG